MHASGSGASGQLGALQARMARTASSAGAAAWMASWMDASCSNEFLEVKLSPVILEN
jgi:hypothetical protein